MPKSKRATPVETDGLPLLEAEKREKGGIQSLERAFGILEQIARAPSGATLSELSRRLGLHSSTVFHLVQTMVSLGYVRQMRDTKRYRIGRPLFALAATSNDDTELVSLATPALQVLSAKTGEAGHFGVWSGDQVLVLAKTPGAGAFQMTSSVGLLRPAYATGLGKALLAGVGRGAIGALSGPGGAAAAGRRGRSPIPICSGATWPRQGGWAWPMTMANSTRRYAASPPSSATSPSARSA